MAISLYHFDLVDSTMNKSRQLLEVGQEGDFIVIADVQTAGKGRVEGRRWDGSAGASLLMTLALPGRIGIQAAPLKVGLAVVDALRQLQPFSNPSQNQPLALKWPNDLLGIVQGKAKKFGGILCETAGQTLLAGIGINLGIDSCPHWLAEQASSLEELGLWTELPATRRTLEQLALDIAARIDLRLNDEDWLPDYSRLLWGEGKTIEFLLGHPVNRNVIKAVLQGVDTDGRILLREENGNLNAYSSGEISSLCILPSSAGE